MSDREILRNTLSLLNLALFVKSECGTYIFANTDACQLLHRPQSDVIGKDDFDLFTAPSARAMRARESAILHSQASHAYRMASTVKDSAKETIFSSVKYPVFDRFYRTQGILGLSFEITDAMRDAGEIEHVIRNLLKFKVVQLIQFCGCEGRITIDPITLGLKSLSKSSQSVRAGD